jgi:predicted DNA-binding transcriptional regulator AlpA
VKKRDESIEEWCLRRGISRTTFCNWVKRGRAPTVIRIGNVGLITARNDADWERRETRRTKSKAERLERERRPKINAAAGRLAAKSDLHISNRRRKRPLEAAE